MSTLRAKVFRGAAKLFSASTAVLVLQFIFYLVIVRVLGLAGLGAYFDTAIIFTFIQFATTWPSQGFARYVTGYYQGGDVEKAKQLYRFAVLLGLSLGVIALASLWALAPEMAEAAYGSARYASIVRMLALDLALVTYNSYAGIALGAAMRFGRQGATNLLWAVARYGTGMALLAAGYGATGLVAGWVAGDLVNAFFNTYWSRDFLFVSGFRSEIRGALSYAAPLALGGAVVMVLQSFDRIFVLAKLGLPELGSYSVIMIASTVPQMFPNAIGNALMPALVRLEERGQLTPEAVEKAVRYTTTLSIPPLLLVAALGRPLIQLLLGQKFVHDWEAFTILTVGHSLMSYDIPLTQVLMAKRDSRTLALQSVVSAAIIAGLAPPLIDLWFAAGAAVAYVLARLVGFLGVAMPRVRRYGLLRVNIDDYLRLAVASLLTFAPTLLFEYLTGFQLILLPAYVGTGLLLMWAGLKGLNVFKPDDYVALQEAVPVELRGVVETLWRGLRLPMPLLDSDDWT